MKRQIVAGKQELPVFATKFVVRDLLALEKVRTCSSLKRPLLAVETPQVTLGAILS